MELPTDPANTPRLPIPPVAPTQQVLPPLRAPHRPAIFAQILICLIGMGAGWFFGLLGVFLHEGFPESAGTPNVKFVGQMAGALSGLLAALTWMRSVRSRQTGFAEFGGGWLVLCSVLAGIGAAAVTHATLFVFEVSAHGLAYVDGKVVIFVVCVGILLFGGVVGLIAGIVCAGIHNLDTPRRRPR